ncbi:uncharacterized protein LOC121254114 isoform X1 [Juglans microcarpa x Juglans regia]|uniref:uncharacterized protein LOC121254114 isoform X1 n=1 Tax=Juglans microcarpa x Juglans regia TaxID=2249226 RepID=UPI001B7E9A38|nr:uncharacterized protein LOC121254114 isoform X1 [Juglans microcarpa x Juglans regia]XP_041010011.1 uncharacterized protein LOC121254114 isoform X1 [Juglans microcarpa x Juglans regia]
MSGISLAVAPRTEPEETDTAAPPQKKPFPQNQPRQQSVMGNIMESLRLVELQLIAFILVFSVSGLVPLLDLVFPAFTTAYVLVLSRWVFPSRGSSVGSTSQEISQRSKFFRFYVVLGTTIGLFLPLAYVLGGFSRADDHAVRSATPHLFLLSFQILTENVITGLSLFSPPVRALVPLLYTVRRIFVIIDWLNDVWTNQTLPPSSQLKDIAWFWFGRSLAVANLVYFSINLFGFLIPKFLPRSFEKYFRDRNEIYAKTEEDKLSAAINKAQPTDNKKAD